MRYLPALASGPALWRLPMAARSADLLAETAVAGSSPARVAQIARQLAQDPPLALWAACSVQGRTLGDLAEWLAAHARDALCCADPSERPGPFAALVADSLLAAEVCRRQSPGLDPTESEPFVRALLDNAAQWLVHAQVAPGGRAGEEASDAGTARQAGLAVLPSWLAASSAAPQAGSEAACRQRAEQACEAWLAPGAFSDEMLTSLAARLGRLSELETGFAEVVQREKLDAMAEFAAGAGHEINNPLAVIAGRAQLFLREEKDPERRRGLALINAQAMRVYEMIADMRLFARPPELELRRLNLVDLVDHILEELAPRAAEQETQLARSGAPGPLVLDADPVQLSVALKALATNALESLGAGGRVEFDLSRREQETQVRVSDNGPGIAAEDLPRIFDPFFSARQAGRGLGMGLAKCWRIVTAHGGRIEVESPPGHGARFTIRLAETTSVETRLTKQ